MFSIFLLGSVRYLAFVTCLVCWQPLLLYRCVLLFFLFSKNCILFLCLFCRSSLFLFLVISYFFFCHGLFFFYVRIRNIYVFFFFCSALVSNNVLHGIFSFLKKKNCIKTIGDRNKQSKKTLERLNLVKFFKEIMNMR